MIMVMGNNMKKIIFCLIILLLIIGIVGQSNDSIAYDNKSEEMSCAIRLKELGVYKGTNQGFQLDEKATRLEGLLVLIRILGKEDDTEYFKNIKCRFSDVPTWGVKYVNYAVKNNLTKGLSDNLFGSEQELSCKEYAAFLLRALGYSENQGDFSFNTAIEKCVAIGLIDKNEASNLESSIFTRGKMAVLVCNALDTKIKSDKAYLRENIESYLQLQVKGVSVLKYGAKGNGRTDDTQAIQNAINKNSYVYIPDGVYMINGLNGLRPKSNQVIVLSKNAVLKMIPSNSDFDCMFYISGVTNVHIEGGTIIGDKAFRTNINDGNGAGINIISESSSITIKNMQIKDFWGDGVIIGNESASKDIIIESVICSNSRRQGILIRNANNILVKDCLFENTSGIGSESGINIITDLGHPINNIYITNCMAINNAGCGMIISGSIGEIKHIEIKNCYFNNNTQGVYLEKCSDLYVDNTKLFNNRENGLDITRDVVKANFNKLYSVGNGKRGVSLVVSEQKVGTKDISFFNCIFNNNSKNFAGNFDGIRIDNCDQSAILQNIKFSACSFIDDQNVPSQRYGITAGDGVGINKIVVYTDCVFKGNITKDMYSDNSITIKAALGRDGFLNVLEVGAKGDGMTDDTELLQRAFSASNNIWVPKGIYMINTKVGINVKSNQTIVFEEGAVFKAIPNSEAFYTILKIDAVDNVEVSGGSFLGDRYTHFGNSGEWGHGIYISNGSKNIYIKGCKLGNFWGDGIYIGEGEVPMDINIYDTVSTNNMRSGISITHVNNLSIQNCEFSYSNGKKPGAGLNIEPNEGKECTNISIKHSKFFNNFGNGIDINGIHSSIKNVSISDTVSYQNVDGLFVNNCENLSVYNSTLTENRNYGLYLSRDVSNAKFNNLIASKNASLGASLIASNQNKGLIDIEFSNCKFLDNGIADKDLNDGVNLGLYDYMGVIKNIQFKNCSFMDNQAVPTQRFGLYVNINNYVSDVYIDKNCYFYGNYLGGLQYNYTS